MTSTCRTRTTSPGAAARVCRRCRHQWLVWRGRPRHHARADRPRLGADHVIRLLQEAAGQERPFFLRWDPSEPHLPNVVPEPYASLVRSGLRSHLGRAFPIRWRASPLSSASSGAPGAGRVELGAVAADRGARYLGEVSADRRARSAASCRRSTNWGWPRIRWCVYSSDHGDLCGAHGMIDKHYVMYDDVVRVPLLLRWPGRPARATVSTPGHRAARPGRTFCSGGRCTGARDLFGHEPAAAFGGAAPMAAPGHLRHLLTATSSASTASAWCATDAGSTSGTPRPRTSSTTWRRDPGEIANLAADSPHAATLAELRHTLVAWMAATKDPLLNQWTKRQLLDGAKIVLRHYMLRRYQC